MQKRLYRSIRDWSVLAVDGRLPFGPVAAFAQGSAGGSIGNDEKSLSGSRDAPRSVESPARRSKAKPEADGPRRASRNSGSGGGGGNFDGAWVVNSVGLRQHHPGRRGRDQRQGHRRGCYRNHQPQWRRPHHRQLQRHRRNQFRSRFQPQRLRNIPAIERLRRKVDGDETVMFMPVSARTRLTDGAGEPQLCPIRSGIAAHYDPSL